MNDSLYSGGPIIKYGKIEFICVGESDLKPITSFQQDFSALNFAISLGLPSNLFVVHFDASEYKPSSLKLFTPITEVAAPVKTIFLTCF